MFGNSFYFLFSKTCFWEYKEKNNFLVFFKINNMFDQLKFKEQFFEGKKNTEICCYKDLNSSDNSLNKANSLNQTHVFIDF